MKKLSAIKTLKISLTSDLNTSEIKSVALSLYRKVDSHSKFLANKHLIGDLEK